MLIFRGKSGQHPSSDPVDFARLLGSLRHSRVVMVEAKNQKMVDEANLAGE
jgi:hypothetical protein